MSRPAGGEVGSQVRAIDHSSVNDYFHDLIVSVHRLRGIFPQQQKIGAFAGLDGADLSLRPIASALAIVAARKICAGVSPASSSLCISMKPFKPGGFAYVGALGVSVPKKIRAACVREIVRRVFIASDGAGVEAGTVSHCAAASFDSASGFGSEES